MMRVKSSVHQVSVFPTHFAWSSAVKDRLREQQGLFHLMDEAILVMTDVEEMDTLMDRVVSCGWERSCSYWDSTLGICQLSF